LRALRTTADQIRGGTGSVRSVTMQLSTSADSSPRSTDTV
jgi:hypothetical protein